MPTYSYKCTVCDTAFDIQQSFTDSSLTECPTCQGKLRKLFSAVGVTFNGSGFYRNDSRTSDKSSAKKTAAPKADQAGILVSGFQQLHHELRRQHDVRVLVFRPTQEIHAMLNGFKNFIMRGNVIDLAVAVVIGAAFTAVVNAIVVNIFTPLIAAVFQADSLDNALVLPVGDSELKFGAVVGAIITFLIVAAVVYFVFVLPINKMKEHAEARRAAGVVEEKAPVTEIDVLTEIRDLLAKNNARS